MEIIIGQIVTFLAKNISQGKSFKKFTEEFSEATVNWIKPIFLKEDSTSKEVLSDLIENPKDELNKAAATLSIQKALKKNPALKEKIELLGKEIDKMEGINSVSNNTNISTVSGNDNTIIQGNTGGNISINKPK